MNLRGGSWIFGMAILLGCATAVAGQQSAPPKTPAEPQLSTRPAPAPGAAQAARRLRFDVVVTDAAGKPVSGLEEKDFRVLDNGQPDTIAAFGAFGGQASKPEPPVQLIVLLDSVNVGIQYVTFARQEVARFLKQGGGHLSVPVSVVWLTDDGFALQLGPTTDGTALAAQLDASQSHLRSIGRAAGFWGAVERVGFSLQKLDVLLQSVAKVPGRKLLVWVGPGWPMFDTPDVEISYRTQQQLFANIVQISEEMRVSQVTMYSVSLGMTDAHTFLYQDFLKGVRSVKQADLPYLSEKVLSIESGGRVLGPNNDLAGQIERCAQDAGPFYALVFEKPKADHPDEYHELKVQIDKPGLTAHTDTGYYDQP